jgi:hypothetical protein
MNIKMATIFISGMGKSYPSPSYLSTTNTFPIGLNYENAYPSYNHAYS